MSDKSESDTQSTTSGSEDENVIYEDIDEYKPDLLTCEDEELFQLSQYQWVSNPLAQNNRIEFKNDNKFLSIINCEPKLWSLESKPRKDFHLMYKIPGNYYTPPEPIPEQNPNNYLIWERTHVKMPNCTRNKQKLGKGLIGIGIGQSLKPVWTVILKALSSEITTFQQFNDVIKKYNQNLRKFQFNVMKTFLGDHTHFPNAFFTLNSIRKMALELPNLITQSIPMLELGSNKTIFLSRKQIACLLANAFFCTFPRRSKRTLEYQYYPTFNFSILYSSNNSSVDLTLKLEKLKFIFNYFRQVLELSTACIGVVSFERHYLTETSLPDWELSEKSFTQLDMDSQCVSKEDSSFTEVEFADKYVGGGVLNTGIFKEEIRFLLYPELIVSRLFTEVLLDEEALVVTGCARFNRHKGSGPMFKWDGEYIENWVLMDDWGRLYRQVVLIDGMEFLPNKRQLRYEIEAIERELTKTYSGFVDKAEYVNDSKPALVSGKWGFGSFSGDPYLKALIQYMAASESQRDLIIHPLNDNNLCEEMFKLFSFIKERDLKIKDVFKQLKDHKYPHQISENDNNYVGFILEKLQDEHSIIKIK